MIWLTGLLFLLGAPANAASCLKPQDTRTAPCIPSKSEQSGIMSLVKSGMEAEADFQDLSAEEIRLREIAKASGDYEDLTAWEKALSRIDSRAQERDQHFNAALNLTARYYGLKINDSGTVRDGPGNGMAANWAPRFHPRDQFQKTILARQADTMDRTAVYWAAKVGGDVAARTWGDGRVDIYIESFASAAELGAPWELALTLFHESVHFDDLTSRGRGALNSAEFHAYSESARIAESIGVPPKVRAIVERLRDKHRLLALGETIAPGLIGRIVGDGIEEYLESKAQIAFDSRQKELDTIRKSQDALAASLKRQRAARRSAEERPADPPVQDQPWTCWRHLQSSAKFICDLRDVLQDWMAPVGDFARCVREVDPAFYDQDLDKLTKTMPCEEYVLYQGIYAHRQGVDVSKADILGSLAAEGKIRATDPRPLRERLAPPQTEPMTPGSPPPPPPPAPNFPTPVEPDPPSGRPTPSPSVPHCRYHPWCKE